MIEARHLVVALDGSPASVNRAVVLAFDNARIRPTWKVGPVALLGDPELLPWLTRWGRDVMLDLKLHDVPATVAKVVAAYAAANLFGPDSFTRHGRFVTVHAQAGLPVLLAAVKGGVPVLAVTVLTSTGDNELPRVALSNMVLSRASMAADAGCVGVVCSAPDAPLIKTTYPSLVCVCPGVRFGHEEDIASHAPFKVVTPGQAIILGADYVVMGAPIYEAPDPAAAAKRALEEMSIAAEQATAAGYGK